MKKEIVCSTCGVSFWVDDDQLALEYLCPYGHPNETQLFWDSLAAERHAHARRDDLDTSHEAAASVDPQIRESQQNCLLVFRQHGAMCDEQAFYVYHAFHKDLKPQAPSGLRSRRNELVKLGLIRNTGEKVVLRSGRRSYVWEPVE